MSTTIHPHLALVPEPLSTEESDRLSAYAWGIVTDAIEEALTVLPVNHCERPAFVRVLGKARRAAGRDDEPTTLRPA